MLSANYSRSTGNVVRLGISDGLVVFDGLEQVNQ